MVKFPVKKSPCIIYRKLFSHSFTILFYFIRSFFRLFVALFCFFGSGTSSAGRLPAAVQTPACQPCTDDGEENHNPIISVFQNPPWAVPETSAMPDIKDTGRLVHRPLFSLCHDSSSFSLSKSHSAGIHRAVSTCSPVIVTVVSALITAPLYTQPSKRKPSFSGTGSSP